MNAIKSIKSRLAQSNNLLDYLKWKEKTQYYIPIVGILLLFGFQIELVKPNYYHPLFAHSRVKKYFFQFSVPDSLFNSIGNRDISRSDYFNRRYYYPINTDNQLTIKISKGKEYDSNEFDTDIGENYPDQYYYYGYPVSYSNGSYLDMRLQYSIIDAIYCSKKRLLGYLKRESAPILSTDQTLIQDLMESARPKPNKFDALSDIWNECKLISERGVELIKQIDETKTRMVAYSASLSGICLNINGEEVLTYHENLPYHMRLPLYDKIQELIKQYPMVSSEHISKLGAKSWLGIFLTPINCVPQLTILGQFLIFYELSAEYGCRQIGMICYNLDECEFWREVMTDEGSIETIKKEENEIKKFFNGKCPIM